MGTTSSTPAPCPASILNVAWGFAASQCLFTALRLDLFSKLGKEGPMNVKQLESACGLHSRASTDFLNTLVAFDLLKRDAAGVYQNSDNSATFLDRAKETYMGGLLAMFDARLYKAWSGLEEAVKSGLPTNEMRGWTPQHMQEALGANGGRDSFMSDPNFSKAMTGISIHTANRLAEVLPWSQYKSVCDLGAAEGAVPVTIVRRHPHLKGICFDMPAVQPTCEAYVRSKGLQDRVWFHAGDFFGPDPLPESDVYVYGNVLHDWDMAQKRHLLKKAFDSLKSGGRLAVYEAMTDGEDAAGGLLMSLNMVVELPGGFNFGRADCEGWMREAGFASVESLHLWSSVYAVVGTRP